MAGLAFQQPRSVLALPCAPGLRILTFVCLMCPQGAVAVVAAVATAAAAAIWVATAAVAVAAVNALSIFSVVSAHKRHEANGHTFLFVQRVLLMLCAITCAHRVAQTFCYTWVCVLCVVRVVLFGPLHPLPM